MRVSFETAAAALALAFAACGGGSRALPLDELGPEIIAASCHVSAMCGNSPDQATCIASTQIRESQFETLQADIAAGIVKYDGRAARACVDTYAGFGSCTYTALFAIQAALDATCDKIFTGTLPPGGTCFFSEECANHGTCDRTACPSPGGCCAGTCTAPPASVPAGGDCTPADTACVDGTQCVPNPQGTSPLLICQLEVGPGAACSASADSCVSPYGCVPPDPVNSLAGICTAPPGTGEACGPSGLTTCNDVRDLCDTSAFVCVRRTPVGGSCLTTGGGCVGVASCDSATCEARGGPGASCDPVLQSPCLAQLECDPTMHCALPPKGASCR